MTAAFDVQQAVARLDRIQQLAEALAKARGDFAEQQEIAERLAREIAETRRALSPFIKNQLHI
jgi:hypothetical protein